MSKAQFAFAALVLHSTKYPVMVLEICNDLGSYSSLLMKEDFSKWASREPSRLVILHGGHCTVLSFELPRNSDCSLGDFFVNLTQT